MRKYIFSIIVTFTLIPILATLPVYAQDASSTPTQDSSVAADLQKQIDAHNAQITALNKEIAQYETQLTQVSSKKQTLQSTLAQLDLSIRKVTASVNVTKNNIGSTQLQIQQLALGIADKQSSIDAGKAGLSEAMRRLSQTEDIPLIVQVFSADKLSTAWEDINATESLQNAVSDSIRNLDTQKKSLSDAKQASEQKREQLVAQQNTLQLQQGSLSATKAAQTDLLTQTKAQESNYQAIIAQKKSQQASFEQALTDLQTKLQYAVDTSKITPAGQGVLQWPLDTVKITQFFGNTPFASTGAYNGKGHNGIDLGTPIGTPVKAALQGTVLGTGNTDATRGCYSFGKWVFIQHPNGLGTIYAHLSQINVAKGQSVETGQLIGYSGETGYATGPHLHFGVYVASATQIIKLGDATKLSTPCAGVYMPVAPLSGYLNPMNYLPKTGFIDVS